MADCQLGDDQWLERKAVLKDQTVLHDYIAGAIGGGAGMVVGYPFDTVKVLLQIQGGGNRYNNILDCVKNLHTQTTLSNGFFRGLSWPLMSSVALTSIFFGAYGTTLSLLGHQRESSQRSATYYSTVLAAGCVAGAAQLPLSCPVDTLKIVLQSQIPQGDKLDAHKKFNRGPTTAAMDIIRLRGIQGLYRGLSAQALRDIPVSGIFMMTYELLTHTTTSVMPTVPSQVINFFSGGLSGIISWSCILPVDVVKSRIQADPERRLYSGLWDCATKSYKTDGGKIFFKGAVVIYLRSFTLNAVILMVYSECLKLFKQYL
ncbi:solute carrier family 25 member 45-like isoform X1 [Haliotis rubra]|uniref:solute carrier family 25 member 45-like isoform X1 n=1 Tax=Haliotis rubra TaxID=36100 RepID=UPI001EE60DE2|nr:solute carrier family 25 member 45-like isoform X1 [Haliotis rubra]XP_046545249.1 solute carrier family 25 member 45-like isoform X1 [Haliotis rubra]XP_046545250.1 solute carrier family 25 member 45-like isoform X1 [Haliotis rubra]XP_046545251.1 solute carrier family 25 member 45-like isoform X1 [Haliotis rubra]